MSSQIRLSCLSVCLLRCCAIPRGLNFSAIFFSEFNKVGTWEFALKSWEILERFWVIVQVKRKGMRKIGFLTKISLHFENGTRYGHSYGGRRIGTRIDLSNDAIFNDHEPSLNQNFKVTPIFDSEYVINGTRQTYLGIQSVA